MGSQARTTCCILTGAYHPTAPSLFNARKQKNQCKEVIWKCKIVTPFREMNSCFTTGAKRVGSADAENDWNGDPLQLKLRQGKQENLKFTDIHKAVRKWHPREEGPARKGEAALTMSLFPKLFVLRNILFCVGEEGYGGGSGVFVCHALFFLSSNLKSLKFIISLADLQGVFSKSCKF